MSRLQRIRDDQSGFSLIELLVAMGIGVVVLFGMLAVVDTTSRSSARTTARVVANQSARPLLTRIIDDLHSSCISADFSPIQPGSSDDSITYIYASDNAPGDAIAVTPTPTKRTISLNPSTGVLNQTVYPYNTTENKPAPLWTFLPTGTTTQLATNISRATLGSPATSPPIFSYYAYDPDTATVSASALPAAPPNGLSAEDAATVVKVVVSFAVTPNNKLVTPDPGAKVTLSDSALLRFSPASQTAGESLLPCA